MADDDYDDDDAETGEDLAQLIAYRRGQSSRAAIPDPTGKDWAEESTPEGTVSDWHQRATAEAAASGRDDKVNARGIGGVSNEDIAQATFEYLRGFTVAKYLKEKLGPERERRIGETDMALEEIRTSSANSVNPTSDEVLKRLQLFQKLTDSAAPVSGQPMPLVTDDNESPDYFGKFGPTRFAERPGGGAYPGGVPENLGDPYRAVQDRPLQAMRDDDDDDDDDDSDEDYEDEDNEQEQEEEVVVDRR